MQDFFDWFLYNTKQIMPKWLYKFFAPAYHFTLAFIGAALYRFPSRDLFVIGITGTKGKTSTVEFLNTILEEAGYNTAVASTLRFKIGNTSKQNLFKMTMPGRYFLQKFMRDAVNNKCTHAIIEMTSEGAKQHRHRFIALNAFVFTNLSPEHIESHGSYEKYVRAKLSIAKLISSSQKNETFLVVNSDDKESSRFIEAGKKATHKNTYSLSDAEPYTVGTHKSSFTFNGETITLHFPGLFNIYNALAAATLAKALGIETAVIKRGLEKLTKIRGRMEYVTEESAPFDVVVDYAHTADSLQKVFESFPNKNLTCVFGATGGGRDIWKRPEMGRVAARYCKKIILTDDDPYDEDRMKIINEIKIGIDKENEENLQVDPEVVVEPDRKKAINLAISQAQDGEVVILAGKGTDPYLMGPHNTKIKWDDAQFAKEALNQRGF